MRTEAVDRITLIFTRFDVDGDGYLESEDFETMADRVVAAAAGSDDEAKAAMAAGFRGFWNALVSNLDTDHDGRIDFAEYTACVIDPERFDGAIGEFADALAALGDPDRDGLIERPLFTALQTAIGFERPQIDALFDFLGPDGADRITVPAWSASIKEYNRPDKAGIAGDVLAHGAPA
ncbi:EF-hand domain-containing protein [Streptomyces sp. NPDC047002]|uniref:EF-hand domain-containing protein n=1 Tax=Streptomyces sp. NPDC047002 TaxID=3155475 RepID=UPI00345398A9